MKNSFLVILCILIFSSCYHKRIEITPEYIINENWNKTNENAWANSITIQKMKIIRDSIMNFLISNSF